jgi:hypothetical protein
VVMSVCWVACGKGVNDSGHTGDPLITLLGRTEGTISADLPASAVKAALVWTLYNPSAIDCFQNVTDDLQAFMNCGTTNTMVPDVASQVVKLESNFPVSFKLPLFELPNVVLLNGAAGSYIGFGQLDIFNDGNANDQLDVANLEAPSNLDTLLAASDYEVIYREGELSPLWRHYSFVGCPEPPQGFSILHWDTAAPPNCDNPFMCFPPCVILDVSAEQVLNLGAITQYDQQRLCPPGPTEGQILPPDAPPDASAQTQCSDDGWDLWVNPHPERFCTRANTTQFTLLDHLNQGWDLRRNPPAWWPCDVKVDNTQPYPIEGLYQSTGHNLNQTGCDAEGAPVDLDPPFFSIVKNEVFSQMMGQDVLEMRKCRSASDCDATLDPSWGFWGWAEGSWGGSQLTFEALADNQCSLMDFPISVTLEAGVLRLERRIKSVIITLGSGETCDESLLGAHAAELICGSLEVITATVLQ